MRVPVQQMLGDLATFSKSRATEAADEEGDFVDAPVGAWSSSYRALAEKYVAGKHFVTDADAHGNVYLAMREDPHSLKHAQQPGCTNKLSGTKSVCQQQVVPPM